MFVKTIYGRYSNSEQGFLSGEKTYGVYANWEMNMIWQDLLQGKIHRSNFEELTKFGGEGFYLMVWDFMEGEILLAMRIDQGNFAL